MEALAAANWINTFSIKKYEPAKTYGFYEWAQQIQYRIDLHGLAFVIQETKDMGARALATEELSGRMASILNDPYDLSSLKGNRPFSSFEEMVGRPPHPVTPLSVAEFYLLYDRYDDVRYDDEIWDRPPTFREWAAAAVDDRTRFLAEGKRFIDDLTLVQTFQRPHQFARLSVDLYHTDKEIKASFASWLAEKRRMTYVKQPLCTTAKLRQWHRNSVLAYSDISLWCSFSGNPFDNQAVASLILPQYKVETDNPLKDTERDFAVVMKVVTVDRLLKMAGSS